MNVLGVDDEPSGPIGVHVETREGMAERLGGDACEHDLANVPVIVLNEQGDGMELDIVTAVGSGCIPLRVVVPEQEVRLPAG